MYLSPQVPAAGRLPFFCDQLLANTLRAVGGQREQDPAHAYRVRAALGETIVEKHPIHRIVVVIATWASVASRAIRTGLSSR